MPIPQIVIDTNVIVSAMRSRRGASYRLLDLLDSGKFEANVSVPLVLEYESACKRLVGQLALTEKDIDDILNYVCLNSNKRHVFFLWRPFLKDQRDEMVLEVAVAGGCDYIVTFNTSNFQGVGRFGISLRDPQSVSSGDRRIAMSAITITLPESLDAQARALAESEHISLEQLIVLALAEKMSALLTEEYLNERAKRGSKEKFKQAMAKVPDVDPDECDRL